MYLSLVSSKMYKVVKIAFHPNKNVPKTGGNFEKDQYPVTKTFHVPHNLVSRIKEVIKPFEYYNESLYEKDVVPELGKILRKYK